MKSFQNKSFWMPRDAECLTDGDVSYDASSRVERKRAHHWFMDASEPELFCNKKQAVEVVGSRPMSNANIFAWENNSSFLSVSGRFTDRLFGSETVRTFNLVDRITPASGAGNLNLEIKGFEDQFESDSFVGLSMSHTLEDPSSCLSYGGIRKVKVNQVRDSDNGMTISIGDGYNTTDNNVTIPPQYNERTILMCPTSNNAEDNFISMGQTFDKGGASFMLMGQHYSNGGDNIVSMNQPFDKSNEGFIQIGNQYEKVNDRIMSAGPFYNKEPENFIRDEYETNPSGGISIGHDLLTGQPSAQTLNSHGLDNSVDQSINLVRSVAPAVTSKSNAILKNKEPKLPRNVPPNNFPSNVKTLLSTGMFDGLPVKYVSWSREKNLKGIIKGSSYLCGCNDCKFSKALNAYELERHACCKTKHPNNHIFFENGKTIYAVAQELKSTPQEMLFEVIQNVTGSALNQTNFRIWKASFQAATRELQRIYGKDEVIMPS